MDAILTFHSIDSRGSVLSYAPAALRRLLEGLLEDGVDIVSLEELVADEKGSHDRVVLTFDDGIRSVARDALPLLARYRLPATLYVVSSWVGRSNRWPSQIAGAPTFELMSWDELKQWRDAGLAIGCHTASHPHLPELPESEWEHELDGSRTMLESELKIDAEHFAYPYGDDSPAVAERVGRVFKTAVTTDMRFVTGSDQRHQLPRIDAYYLRAPERVRPLFGRRTRFYLQLRASLRGLRQVVRRA